MSVYSPPVSQLAEAPPQAPIIRTAVPRRRFSERAAGLLVVLATFAILYGTMLVTTDFLPYVTDNNESFSSLWHAYNLYHFDVRQSAGLTDETFSPHPEAHPFVHTHQGNMPRLFAFVLYVLGARSIEAQIGLTTLIVGTATVALAYQLFWRLVGPLFATVACLTLITDYLFFGQWAVVTYRIWHFFFVFGALLCAYEIGGKAVRRWAICTVALFTLLFYYELVFAGFTTVFAGLFAGWRLRRQVKRLALTWAVQFAGMVTGVSVLIAQLTAHLGWEVAKEDFYLTFVARNAAATDPALREYMTEFFLSRNIIFWQNVVDARTYRTVEQFLLLLTTQHVQWYTPLLALLSAMLLLGWAAGMAGDSLTDWLHRRFGHDGPAAQGGSPPPAITAAMAEWCVVTVTVLGLSTAFLTLMILRDDSILGLPTSGASFGQRTGGLGWLVVVGMLIVAGLAVWDGTRSWRLLARRVSGYSPARLVLAAAVLLSAISAIRGHSYLYLQSYAPLWNGVLQQLPPQELVRPGAAILLGLGVALAMAGPRRVLGVEASDRLRGIGPYLVCGAVAYTTVYLISPGYVMSGYLSRFAPLAVFVLNVALAVSLYVVVAATIHAIKLARERFAQAATPPNQLIGAATLRAVLLVGGLTFFVGFWLQVQILMISLMPPDSYAFLKLLGQPPLRGKTLFSNGYVAPMTVYTGEWGYTDTTLALWKLEATDIGYFVERGKGEYMWLRDRKTNPAYLKPDLFVCVRPASVFALLQIVTDQANEREGCGTIPLVAGAADGTQQHLYHEIVARDPSPMDSWAIVRMDWDYPPLLYPLGDGPARRFVDVDRVEIGDRMTLRVRYTYFHQEDVPETGTKVQLEGVRQDGSVCTVMEQTDVDTLYPSTNVRGRFRVVVTPSTATKAGQRFESARFVLGRDANIDPCRNRTVRPG